jgi:hypothetical protein
MRTIRWAMSLAGKAAIAAPRSGLDVFENGPTAGESGAFIDSLRGTSHAAAESAPENVGYATPGTPFATPFAAELGIPLA